MFASSPVQIPDEIQKLITKKTATEMDTSTVAISPIKTTVSMRGIVAEVSTVGYNLANINATNLAHFNPSV